MKTKDFTYDVYFNDENDSNNKEKSFNYYYNGVAIPKDQFVESVPSNWRNELDEHGEYSYGYYRAIER